MKRTGLYSENKESSQKSLRKLLIWVSVFLTMSAGIYAEAREGKPTDLLQGYCNNQSKKKNVCELRQWWDWKKKDGLKRIINPQMFL